jgi:hypothetical protein
MTKADCVHSTPPLNSSSIQDANPPPDAPAESMDSFSPPTAIGQPESGNLASESGKLVGGLSRRHMRAGLAVLPAAVSAVFPATASVDPIFAAIEEHDRANAAFCADFSDDIPDEVGDRYSEAYRVVLRTRPTTPAGLAALTGWARERSRADYANLQNEDTLVFAATIDDAVKALIRRPA